MKGFWRIIESAIAVMIILGFLATAGSVYLAKNNSMEGVGAKGYEALKSLDQRGVLRPNATAGNSEAINSLISFPGYNHSIVLCPYNGNCSGSYEISPNVAVSRYIISGHENYAPVEVRLYIWR